MVMENPEGRDVDIHISQKQKRRPSMFNVDALAYQLSNIIGSEKVTTSDADLACYAFSGTGEPPEGQQDKGILPDIVVQPKNTKDVLEVVRLANRHIIPIYPVTTGFQSSYPHYGGIVMDLYRMNRILEINAEDGYAVVEPGVTYAQLTNKLRPLGYRFPFGSFPETTSIIGAML